MGFHIEDILNQMKVETILKFLWSYLFLIVTNLREVRYHVKRFLLLLIVIILSTTVPISAATVKNDVTGYIVGFSWASLKEALVSLNIIIDEKKSASKIMMSKQEKKVYGSTTILVYMIGSDLESLQGRATDDLNEILEARESDTTNILIQSGGTANWKNQWMADGKTQRLVAGEDDITLVETLDGVRMTDQSSLADFIQWGTSAYPADRYVLILWDHGDGTMRGYGRDELNNGKTMRLSTIREAIKNSGVHFDIIGFDACLMGTLEIAYSLRDCADYLIASEELIPACGWYYATWLNTLSVNPGLDNLSLSKLIVDSFTLHAGIEANSETTLSVLRLDGIENIYLSLCKVFEQAVNKQPDVFWQTISRAKVFGRVDGGYDQFDLLKVMNDFDGEGTEEVIAAIQSAIVYSRASTSVTDANGVAFYFPRDHGEEYKAVRADLIACGYNEAYFKLFDQWLLNNY